MTLFVLPNYGEQRQVLHIVCPLHDIACIAVRNKFRKERKVSQFVLSNDMNAKQSSKISIKHKKLCKTQVL